MVVLDFSNWSKFTTSSVATIIFDRSKALEGVLLVKGPKLVYSFSVT